MVVVIQGASRGLGFAMAKHAYLNSPYKIVATCRKPDQALNKFKEHLGTNNLEDRFYLLPLDVTNENSIREAAEEISKKYGKHSVRALINCAGILVNPEKAFSHLETDNIMNTYLVNCVGPGLVYKHFMDLLSRSGSEPSSSNSPIKLTYPVLASISARVGSVSDNRFGGWMSYRCSKAALNMLGRCASIELKNHKRKAISVTLHPGTVRSDLSKSHLANTPEEKIFTSDQAASYLWTVIGQLELEDSGFCYAWDGKKIPY